MRAKRIKRRLGIALGGLVLVSVALFAVLKVQAGIAVWAPPAIQLLSPSAVGSTGAATCVVADNKVYCWGALNTYGQLGTGDNSTTSLIPRQISDPNGVLTGKKITGLALANSGTVCVVASNVPYCWGRGDYGALGDNTTSDRYYPSAVTTSGVLAGKSITDITAGDGHICVVASGAAYCWGANGQGRLGDGTATQRNTPVAVNTSGVLSGKTVTSISAGSGETCVLASGAAYCWGDDTVYGQLGNDSSYTSSMVPVAVDTSGVLSGKTIAALDTGQNGSCALTTDNILACWGYGLGGQLGNNTTTTSPIPVAVTMSGVLSGKTIAKLTYGNFRSCVIDTNGDAYCWGSSHLGDGTGTGKLVPTAVTTTGSLNGMKIVQIAEGVSGNCFLNDQNRMYCTNSSATFGGLGDNTMNTSTSPVQVLFNATFNAPNYRLYANANSATPGSPLAGINTSATLSTTGQAFRVRMGVKTEPLLGNLSNYGQHTCGITDGKVYCWGINTYGELGNNSTSESDVPVAVDTSGVLSGKIIKQVSAGQYHTCAIDMDGKAYCWGYGASGRLGYNSSTESHVPVAVDTTGVLSGKTLTSIASGADHTCAIDSAGAAYCWGAGGNGQLGNNGTANSLVPVAVSTSGVLSGKSVLSISTGYKFTCVVASDNNAYCWGYNNQGQIGDNTSGTDRLVPVAVYTSGALSGKTVLSVSAKGVSTDIHACAIASDAQAYCWGRNYYGELGNNSTTDSSAPVAVTTSGVLSGKTLRSIAAGGVSTCALDSAGAVYCWGNNANGRLGDNSTTESHVPVAVNTSGVLSGKTVNRLFGGSSSACVGTTDEKTYCWGSGSGGRFGVNTTSDSLVPMLAPLTDGYISGADIPASKNTYKLQFAQKTVSTCSAQTGFADVTASSAIAFNTNASVSNGASITGTADDPVSTTDSVPQAYISASGAFTNTSTITSGKTGLWDFSLKDNSGLYDTSYCLRMTYGDGSAINGTVQYPELTTVSKIAIKESAYRLYENADSITPGTALAATDTAGSLTTTGQTFRLRTGLVSVAQMQVISSGASHVCGIADSKAYCWGDNFYGQLGNNSTSESDVPVAVDTSGVLSGKTVIDVEVGDASTCALTSDGQVYCWGHNNYGQVGDNSTSQRNVPVAVYTSGALSGKLVLKLAMGSNHACVVASDNNTYCWGYDSHGQLGDNSTTQSSVPVAVDTSGVLSGKAVSYVTTGQDYSCVIASDSNSYCWGYNNHGQLGDNSTSESHVPVAVNTAGVLSGKTISLIDAGVYHTCAIASDNNAYCWGYNAYGQLGNNSISQSTVPVAVSTSGVLSGKTVLSVGVGGGHTCAIASDNNAYCWGYDSNGQLGDNSITEQHVPVAVDTSGVLSGMVISSLSAGTYHTCAIASDNTAYCWGGNTTGQLGDSSTTESHVAVSVHADGNIDGPQVIANANQYKLQFAKKTLSTCSVQTGFADVTGSTAIAFNTNGSVSNGTSITSNANDPVPTGDSVPQTYISAEGTFTNTSTITVGKTGLWDFSLKDNSGLYDTSYCLRMTYGDGANIEGSVQYPEVKTVPKIDANLSAYRFYQNADSLTPGTALGATNTATNLVAPNQAFRLRAGVKSSPKLTGITAGSDSTCAINYAGNAYCWGDNVYGTLGIGMTGGQYDNSDTPLAVVTTGVLSGKTVLSITAGGGHTCAVASDHLAYCWGLNDHGQLGNNSTTNANAPVAVDTSGVLSGKTILSISAGDGYTCAIASDNNAYCWGYNNNGQLGNNSTTESHVPVAVSTSGVLLGKTVTSVVAGVEHVCAIASDNNAYCWGLGIYGQFGNGGNTSSSVPVAISTTGVLSGKTILSLAIGPLQTCVVASDNKAYCTGLNYYGALGDGTNIDSNTMVAVSTTGVLSGKTILSMDGGSIYSQGFCALASDNNAYCWGQGDNAQLGNGGTANSNVPVAVSTSGVLAGKTIASIAVGSGYGCIIASDYQPYCWGSNWVGQLGNGAGGVAYSAAVVASVVDGHIPGVDVTAAANSYKLQYAVKSVSVCSAQTTGFADVTTTSAIAFNTNASVTHGSTITTNANDPVATANSVAESYISAVGSFTNPTAMNGGKIGIWDFSLKDNSGLYSTSYCLRIVYADGSTMASTMTPELRTTTGTLSVGFVDGADAPLSNPTINFVGTNVMTSWQAAYGVLGTSTQKLRIYNDLTTNGWNVSMAATNGPTALWDRTDHLAKYDFNDITNYGDGSDTDTLVGIMAVAPDSSTITSSCSTTGLTRGTGSYFDEGTIDSITLLSASSTAAMGCAFDLTNIGLSQAVPAAQPAGTYTLNMTITVVAL